MRLGGSQRADQGGKDAEWRWTKGFHGLQKHGSGGFRSDNAEDQEDSGATRWWTRRISPARARVGWMKVCACGELECQDLCQHGPEKHWLEQAQTLRAKILASTDLKNSVPRKRDPGGQRYALAWAGRIMVLARGNQSATNVSRSTGETNSGGWIESRALPVANKGERKQRMMLQQF